MNQHATTREEILSSIDDPVLRKIKEFDLNARCNPTSFRNLVMIWMKAPENACCTVNQLRDYANNILEEYKRIEPYKERDRVFRFLFLHHLELLTFEEYKADWLTFWERGLKDGLSERN